ncbi:helicase c2 [Candidatus Nitrosoglobus terrae]|uniref:Helicase c2 n=1 Tax=Candidatus Nitrosoglobus terrae TaxID=1630141 RepID=A0A1Q2SMJ3_9GAMM|nr:ATP-dependent DNA helicase [Candidatus Nitrosoglobus terrae]BAW80333.1 helicase c2 [Candidatus Nitrosoglobus terrae]
MADLLGEEGPLATHIKGFAPRRPQQEMAEAVRKALKEKQILVTEAGTGTGKTYAYLVPALLSENKIIISTGTKHLQDQLYHRDLPLVKAALGVSAQTCLLKGRANYLCLHRLYLLVQERSIEEGALAANLAKIQQWARRTRTGDISELSKIPENSPLWPRVTSTVDNCFGQDCPVFSECYFMVARRQAQDADILVINHHLLLSDIVLQEKGYGDVLPMAAAYIIDEAHQLPEVASRFFGQQVNSRQLLELIHDSRAKYLDDPSGMANIRDICHQLEQVTVDFQATLGAKEHRFAWREAIDTRSVALALENLSTTLANLELELKLVADRDKGLENCYKQAGKLQAQLAVFSQQPNDDWVYWFETRSRSFILSASPLDIGENFHAYMARQQASWIFTSATIAVGECFEHFNQQLNLVPTVTYRWESPFDFRQQALLYQPAGLPDPHDPHYIDAVIEAVLPVLIASQGRAFLLFTSHQALKKAYDLLRNKILFPLLVQGSAPRSELLTSFRSLGNAILLGTSSFWEGVDVRGSALSCVIIDKLPFASPSEPLLQARIDAIRRRGGNPFMDYQLPHAIVQLKQGVGRLIRDAHDRGLLMLCDPRLHNKSYGWLFLKSLPNMPRTQDIADVKAFFAKV